MAVQYIVETGTGASDSTSYASLDFIKQYWENVGYDYSTISDSSFEIWGNRGTITIEGLYLTTWTGDRVEDDQSLSWPREYATYIDDVEIDDDIVPVEVKNALAEMVYILSTGADVQPTIDKEGNILKYSVAVENAVSESTTYADGSTLNRDILLTVTDALVRLTGGASSMNSLYIQRV